MQLAVPLHRRIRATRRPYTSNLLHFGRCVITASRCAGVQRRAERRGRDRAEAGGAGADASVHRSAYTYYKSVAVALIRSPLDGDASDAIERRRDATQVQRVGVCRMHRRAALALASELASDSRTGKYRDRACHEIRGNLKKFLSIQGILLFRGRR